jgi:hypothetical protein
VAKHRLHSLHVRARIHQPIAEAVTKIVKPKAVPVSDAYASCNRSRA